MEERERSVLLCRLEWRRMTMDHRSLPSIGIHCLCSIQGLLGRYITYLALMGSGAVELSTCRLCARPSTLWASPRVVSREGRANVTISHEKDS